MPHHFYSVTCYSGAPAEPSQGLKYQHSVEIAGEVISRLQEDSEVYDDHQ